MNEDLKTGWLGGYTIKQPATPFTATETAQAVAAAKPAAVRAIADIYKRLFPTMGSSATRELAEELVRTTFGEVKADIDADPEDAIKRTLAGQPIKRRKDELDEFEEFEKADYEDFIARRKEDQRIEDLKKKEQLVGNAESWDDFEAMGNRFRVHHQNAAERQREEQRKAAEAEAAELERHYEQVPTFGRF